MWRKLGMAAEIAILWGCHPPSTPLPGPPHRMWGVVHSSNGIIVKDCLVVVTDLETSQQIATTRVSNDGTFEVDVLAKQVAVTVTNPKGWAYLPKMDVNDHKLNVELSENCMPLRGDIRLEGMMPQSIDPVRIARQSNENGDMFAASLDSHLRFEACLPRAQYQVMLPPQFANRVIAASVPQRDALSVHAITQQLATTATHEPLNLEHVSRDVFLQQFPRTVQLLGLGESNHGTREFTLERTSLMLALARERGFATVLIEAAFGGLLPANAYIHGAAIDLDDAIGRTGFWLWKTEEFRHALQEFRNYNQSAAPDRQISIMGIDVQQPEGAIDDLLSASIGLSADVIALLGRLRDKNGVAWNEFSQSEQDITRRSLEQLASRRDQGGLASEANRHALSALSLLCSLELIEQPTFWDQMRSRDHAMAKMALAMLGLTPGGRATLWAHLEHVSREHIVGIPSLGFNLSTVLGERYLSYALLAYEGRARAKDPQHLTMPPAEFSIGAAPLYALEGVLTSNISEKSSDITYWNFWSRSTRTSTWLTELHWLRAFGAIYPGEERSHELYNLSAIDGAVLFKNVTPSRPLNLPAPPPPPG